MPYGSPSSRFPRSPMWPLDRAKSDSDCASRSRPSVVSLTDHGSTGYGRCTITCGPRGRPGPAPRCRHRGAGPGRPLGPHVIVQRPYPVEPWSVSETTLGLDLLAQSESLFALSNGHIAVSYTHLTLPTKRIV